MSPENTPNQNNQTPNGQAADEPTKREGSIQNEFEDTSSDLLSNSSQSFPFSPEETDKPASPAPDAPSVSPEPAAEPAEEKAEVTEPDDDVKPGPRDLDSELEEFDSLIGNYLDGIVQHEVSSIISAKIVEVHSDHVLIDLGDKAEGMIDIQEFFNAKGYISVKVGDKIDVEIQGRDEETGRIQASHQAARSHGAWKRLEEAYANKTPVTGVVVRAVKSGLLVDMGINVFMPASQIADHRVNDLEKWVGKDVEAEILDLDRDKNRAVISRRILIEKAKKEALKEILSKINEGDVVQGKIRSIQNFGAFLELDGIDGFLPREEISWDRGVLPASILTQDAVIKVKIIKIEPETGRIKVSRKALRQDPWETAAEKHPIDSQVKGEVASITRFGAFVRIEEGLTGLIHVSELSWSRDPQKVTDHVKEGDSVHAVVLSVDTAKRRLSLGLKQLAEDPWIEAEKLCPVGTNVKGVVTNLATFGAFVRLTDNIEGLIHISDFSWEEKIKHPGEVLKVGEEVEARVLKTDRGTQRISLGLKQLTEGPVDRFLKENRVGATVEGEIVRIIPVGAFISLVPQGPGGKLDGFLHVSQISTERVEKPEDELTIGEKIECKIMKIDKRNGKISLSRKALVEHQEREAIRKYGGGGSAKDSGSLKLGDLMAGIKLNAPAPQDAPAQEKKKPAPKAPEPEAAAPVTETPAPEPAAPITETPAPEPEAPEAKIPAPEPELEAAAPVVETPDPEPEAPAPAPEPEAPAPAPEPEAPAPEPEPEIVVPEPEAVEPQASEPEPSTPALEETPEPEATPSQEVPEPEVVAPVVATSAAEPQATETETPAPDTEVVTPAPEPEAPTPEPEPSTPAPEETPEPEAAAPVVETPAPETEVTETEAPVAEPVEPPVKEPEAPTQESATEPKSETTEPQADTPAE